ncbi:unnamed protein product [Rhizoctonia solani]|uniref:Cyclin N-terminal domain-containing protein n=1 Tax=Rhizoctonia solani TaxID=456999 RepID=A0A8H2WKZ9_9AGAM|nr:unnamed protein product [Rhizoctonia solani]
MASLHQRQDPDDMEEEPPLDLNPGVPAQLPPVDSSLYSQLAALDAPNSIPRSSLPSLINPKFLAKSQVPPRPKPPVPFDYFVYPKRNWRSMSKEHIRMHITDRYGAKQRYVAAYKEWEDKHSQWVFGIYHLVRAVTKPQRQEVPVPTEQVQESSTVDAPKAGEQTTNTTATDVIGDLDVNFETALTALQEGAEVDELDRVKRWWIQVTEHDRQHRLDKRDECGSTPVLPILDRQGIDAFGSRGSSVTERPGTPDIKLPDQAARKIHSSMSSCVPPKVLPGQEDSSMSESEDEEEEEQEDSCPSWRIYSDQCACGYAGCHCRSWTRWWNKTFQMLKYVQYAALPISVVGASGVPVPRGDGATMRYARVCVSERKELVARDPPVQSLRRPKSPKSKKRPRSSMAHNAKLGWPYFVPVQAGQMNNHGGSTSTLDAQPPPKYIFKSRWEDYFDLHTKIPDEYIMQIAANLDRRACLHLPQSVVPPLQWPSRNRTLQWISYVQYTYGLPPEIFFLAINILDRYAAGYPQLASLNGPQWDVVGVSCLWLAWKYENHTSVPQIEHLIAHSELSGLTRDNILSAEWAVRRTIGLDLSYTSPLIPARLDLARSSCTRDTAYVARFLVEISTTVPQLVTCRSTVVGPISAWMACVLTGVPPPSKIKQNTDNDRLYTHEIAMYILMGVLNMPRPIEKPREQALFYKWTLPIVNNIAGWCQQTLDSVWPDRTSEGFLPDFAERLPQLTATVRSRPFQLGSGPSPVHALFET